MANLSDMVECRRVEFETLKLAITKRLGISAERLKLQIWDDAPGIDDRIVDIAASLLAQKIVNDDYSFKYSYRVYASWWQHLKDSHAPMWFKSYFPVRYLTEYGEHKVKFERYATYPKTNIPVREDPRLFYEVLGGEEVIRDVLTPSKASS